MEDTDNVINILPKIDFLFLNVQEAQTLTRDTNPDVKVLMKKLKEICV